MTIIERLQETGIHRSGTPKSGFHYKAADHSEVCAADLKRIRDLKIPPAWTETAVNRAESGRVQAVGKDAAGRWQYIYHQQHVRESERKKFLRVIRFAESLPAIRKAVARDLRKSDLSRERVLAGIVRILSIGFLRPGSEVYANEHGSYGVATLRPRHVAVKGKSIAFDFRGKSRVKHQMVIEDRRVSRLIRELLKHPNRRVFKFEDAGGKLVDVRPRQINEYIREAMGEKFSAKDFRTWAGTLICACALARRLNRDDNENRSVKRQVTAAIKETAEALGNTPAVCRSAYICPVVIEAFENQKAISKYFESVDRFISYRGTGLHPAEKSLLRLLKKAK